MHDLCIYSSTTIIIYYTYSYTAYHSQGPAGTTSMDDYNVLSHISHKLLCSHNIHSGGISTARLVGGSVTNEGHVEVFRDGEWQSLCDDSWDTREGDVVCRQLGYAYAIKVVGNALFGEGINGQWKTQFECLGTEGSVEDCYNLPRPCSHKEDAGVICSLTNTSEKLNMYVLCAKDWNFVNL